MIKVSVVISVCDNRYELFERSLHTWAKQTLSKEFFELVVVDDAERNDLLELCRKSGLQYQFIRIDNSKCDLPVTTFIPVLSNNVGFRQSRGGVVIVTGPETLQAEKNLEIACEMFDRRQCAYGLVHLSSPSFVDLVSKNWDFIKDKPFEDLLCIKGASIDCLTKPPHPPAYWFLTVVAKRHVEAIGGVDERFAQGICGEDDDFANRMRGYGVTPVFEHRMIGIHQDHSVPDSKDKKHSIRQNHEGIMLRKRNIALMRKNLKAGLIVANLTHRWGDEKVITFQEVI